MSSALVSIVYDDGRMESWELSNVDGKWSRAGAEAGGFNIDVMSGEITNVDVTLRIKGRLTKHDITGPPDHDFIEGEVIDDGPRGIEGSVHRRP